LTRDEHDLDAHLGRRPMTGKRIGSPEVQPNTLSDERAPNTFRIDGTSGPLPTPRPLPAQGRDQGDANRPPRRRWALPPLRLLVWAGIGIAAAYIVFRLLTA
jgi:hypothetical protein